MPHSEIGTIVSFELSTEDVETVVETPSNSPLNFIGNVAGNLGMLFGISLHGLMFGPITDIDDKR